MTTIEHAVAAFTRQHAVWELEFLRDLDTSDYDGFSYQAWLNAIEEFEAIIRACDDTLAEC